MTSQIHAELLWLPAAPSDFRQACRDLAPGQQALGQAVRRLAHHALDDNGLRVLAKAIARLRAAGADLKPLTPFRLGLVGNSTLDLLGPALVASSARHGIALEIIQADFGQALQEALSPDSRLNQAGLDAVLLAFDYHAFAGLGAPGSADAAAGFVATLRDGFRRNGVPLSIVQTVAPPAEPLFGHLDRNLDRSPRAAVDAINRTIAQSVADSPDVLFDVAALAETVGLAAWHSPLQ